MYEGGNKESRRFAQWAYNHTMQGQEVNRKHENVFLFEILHRFDSKWAGPGVAGRWVQPCRKCSSPPVGPPLHGPNRRPGGGPWDHGARGHWHRACPMTRLTLGLGLPGRERPRPGTSSTICTRRRIDPGLPPSPNPSQLEAAVTVEPLLLHLVRVTATRRRPSSQYPNHPGFKFAHGTPACHDDHRDMMTRMIGGHQLERSTTFCTPRYESAHSVTLHIPTRRRRCHAALYIPGPAESDDSDATAPGRARPGRGRRHTKQRPGGGGR
jgi:hypothetical protein